MAHGSILRFHSWINMWVAGITVDNTRNQKKKGDLIEAFKILKKFDNVDSNVWFKLSSTGLRGHDYKLFKQHFLLNIRK